MNSLFKNIFLYIFHLYYQFKYKLLTVQYLRYLQGGTYTTFGQTKSTYERKRQITVYITDTIQKIKWRNDRSSELRKIRRQYPFFSKEVFPTDYFFGFIFCSNFCLKFMNVGKNLVISAIPQEKFSNHYEIVQQ